MKLKVKELLRIYPSLKKIANSTDLNPKSIYGAARAINQIESEFDTFEKRRRLWYKELGELIQVPNPKKPGEMMPHPRGDMKIKPENEEKFEGLRSAFEDSELEIYDFKLYLSDLVDNPKTKDLKDDNKKFSVSDIGNLMHWIIDDLAKEEKVPTDGPKEHAPTC
jgi:hypothetical protein